jgi:hypothetical protein
VKKPPPFVFVVVTPNGPEWVSITKRLAAEVAKRIPRYTEVVRYQRTEPRKRSRAL